MIEVIRQLFTSLTLLLIAKSFKPIFFTFLMEEQEQVERLRLPKGKEVTGIIEQRLGSNRMLVKCFDGHRRVCRVPGRIKCRLWLREGDIVIVEPWEYQSEEKGDILFKYSKTAEQQLHARGLIKISEEF